MQDMRWAPNEEKDQKVNQYLEKINHAPYAMIFVIVAVLFCLSTVLFLVGVF